MAELGPREPPAVAPTGRTSARRRRLSWTEAALDPAYGLAVFSGALLLLYALAPVLLFVTVLPVESFLRLASLTSVGVASMWLGTWIPLFDSRFQASAMRLDIDGRLFVGVTWGIFLLFMIVTFATASSIPLLSALQGADSQVLSQERGDFLKGRQGAGLVLLYMSTFLVNTVVPYSIVLMYSVRSRVRHLLAALFFLFCISFVQKALFLNLVLPFLAYLAAKRQLRVGKASAWFVGSLGVLLAGTVLSSRSGEPRALEGAFDTAAYFTAQFAPSSAVGYFLWRVFAVPLFTATDTLFVHAESFGGRALHGATSSLLAWLFGLERVNLERFVFEYQFGGWNDTANANAVFIVDAFVNFGWIGVVLFGLMVGQVFRWFRLSSDIAFRSLWPLFAFVLFSASLIGMMLSNGFLFMLSYALVVRVRPGSLNHFYVRTPLPGAAQNVARKPR